MSLSSRQADALQMLGFQSKEFPLQSLDLTSGGAVVQWDVTDYTTGTIRLFGSNAVAIVTVERSHDGGASWENINPPLRRLGSGSIHGIPCAGANRLRLRVSTADGAGTTENVSFLADQSKAPISSKVLAQLRPAGTSAVSLWVPAVSGTMDGLWICNTHASAAARATIYLDPVGATYDATTALVWNQSVPANSSPVRMEELGWSLQQGGSVGVKTDTGSSLTFTAFGRDGALDAAR